jgi:serine/threonine protein kinase
LIRERDIKDIKDFLNTMHKAPEVYNGGSTSAIDVCSFAIMLSKKLTGKFIFSLPISGTALMKKIVTGVRPVTRIETVAGMIRRCWPVNAKDRDTFEHV